MCCNRAIYSNIQCEKMHHKFYSTSDDQANNDEFKQANNMHDGKQRVMVSNLQRKIHKKFLQQMQKDDSIFQLCKEELGIDKSFFTKTFSQFITYFDEELISLKSVHDALSNTTNNNTIKHNHSTSSHKHAQNEIFVNLYLQYVTRFHENELVDTAQLSNLADMRTPHEWYRETRKLQRKIVFHCGPTNSGKTFHAFERLSQAKSGCYLAPLRLLATEGYVKLKQLGVACSLITGDYQVIDENATHVAATVEMANIYKPVEVCVIDEIQMIEDFDRGASWTRAFLGMQAEEIHVCGEERTATLLQELCKDTGDELTIKTYKRLTPLRIQEQSINSNLNSVREGDAIVCFSRRDIFKFKQEIESSTKYRVAVVYGGLPPHVRIQQAQLFNDKNSQYDVLVATDAIGFGLNLNIRRIIFSTMSKFDGYQERLLEPSQVRQIAGRAGRYLTRFPDGEVTSFRESDRTLIHRAFQMQLPAIKTAGLRPSADQLESFSQEFPQELKFSELLNKFEDFTTFDDKYFMCSFDSQKQVADLIQDIALGAYI